MSSDTCLTTDNGRGDTRVTVSSHVLQFSSPPVSCRSVTADPIEDHHAEYNVAAHHVAYILLTLYVVPQCRVPH